MPRLNLTPTILFENSLGEIPVYKSKTDDSTEDKGIAPNHFQKSREKVVEPAERRHFHDFFLVFF